jgi:hypothetical protein
MNREPHHVNATTAKIAAEILDAYCDRGPSGERPMVRRLAEALFAGRPVVVNSEEVS